MFGRPSCVPGLVLVMFVQDGTNLDCERLIVLDSSFPDEILKLGGQLWETGEGGCHYGFCLV